MRKDSGLSNYTRVERIAARVLGYAPGLKRHAKRIYQRLVYLRYCENQSCVSSHEMVPIGRCTAASFFGYYDHSPVSPDGRYILWHETELDTRAPPPPDTPISVVLGGKDGIERARWTTCAYNWQQGARAHWISNSRFVFNDVDMSHRRYIGRVIDVVDGSEQILKAPVYDCHDGNEFAVSINFRRLALLRPDYGYFSLPALDTTELGNPCSDGLWVVSLKHGEPELLVSLDRLTGGNNPSPGRHKVNHPMIDPSGKRCAFIYRRDGRGGRYDQLWTVNLDGSGLRCVLDTGMVSHLVWCSSEMLVGYVRAPDGRDGFHRVQINGEVEALAKGGVGVYGDGHPSLASDGTLLIDTYPDKARMQHLFRLSLEDAVGSTANAKWLGSFFHGFSYEGPQRCDLHPRFGADSDEVFFDSVWSGVRKLYRMRINAPVSG